MAESSSENQLVTKEDIKKEFEDIKKEVELPVDCMELEQQECVVCVSQSPESFNIYDTHTALSRTTLHIFLSEFTSTELPFCPEFAKYICKTCLDLVNSLEQAKVEYVKLKNSFEAIISENPLFFLPQPIQDGELNGDYPHLRDDSEMDALSEIDKETQHLNDGTENNIIKRKTNAQRQKEYRQRIKLQMKESVNNKNALRMRDYRRRLKCSRLSAIVSQEAANVHKKEFSDSATPMDDNNPEDGTKAETMLIPQTTVGAFVIQKKKPVKCHECAVCQRQFQQKCHLRDHFRTHTGEKPFECNICKRTFVRKDHLQIHERTHTEKPYECPMCNRKYNQKHYLKVHMRSHTSEKLFKCDVCERRFDHKHTLKRHEAIHTGEKPFDCHLCKRKFSRNYHLKRHLAVHEKEAANSAALKIEAMEAT